MASSRGAVIVVATTEQAEDLAGRLRQELGEEPVVVLDVDAISRRVAEELAREDAAACGADGLAREGAAHEAGELAHEDAACEAYDGRKVGAGRVV